MYATKTRFRRFARRGPKLTPEQREAQAREALTRCMRDEPGANDAHEAGLFGDDAGPFASRCVRLTLTNQGLVKALAPRLRDIAQREGLDGQSEEAYVKLMQRCKNNVRLALQEIEAGCMLE